MVFPYNDTDVVEHQHTPLDVMEKFYQYFQMCDASTLLQIIDQKCYWIDSRYHFLKYWECLVLDALWLQKTGFKLPRPNDLVDF